MDILMIPAKRRRQTVHGNEICKVPDLGADFKEHLPQMCDISSEQVSSDSKNVLPFRSMKSFRQSLTFQRKKNRPKTNNETEAHSPVTAKSKGLIRSLSKKDMPTSIAALHGTMKTEFRRRLSARVLQHKLNKLQDYSLPLQMISSGSYDAVGTKERSLKERAACCRKEEMIKALGEVKARRTTSPPQASQIVVKIIKNMSTPGRSPQTSTRKGQRFAKKKIAEKDTDLQQKIEHEIKMREGTTKLLAASKHPNQRLEAARSLLCSNTRIIAYMTELQRRKTQEVLGQSQSTEGNQLPCRAQISVSDIRIPLMWKDTDHFKNKGDYRQYAVFCLLKVGTEIFDTSMITNVDRSMTDITFEDVVLFQDIPHDFELKLEVYCHKLHEELSVANTPKKIRKKITDISGSVGRSVGKRLSGLNDADVIGSMVLGPRFELVAKGTLRLQDVDDSVRTFDFELERNSEGKVHELPLFGNYCCRVAAVPDCLVKPVVSGFLNLQEDDDLSRWRRYWCVLKNLQLACWSSPADIEVTQPLLTISVTKSTQISDADPSTCKQAHTFLIKTVSLQGIFEHTLAADSKDELNKWWDGFQQHLLDQALWKHACDGVMTIKPPTKNKMSFYRKSSIYDDTPLIEPDTVSDSIVSDLKVDDAQLSHMLTTLMGEASQIRGSRPGQEGATSENSC